MIVSIAHELFSLENHIWVESIMSFFYEERHIWFIEDEEKIFQSEWFLENTPKKKQIIRENIEKYISYYENDRSYYLSIPLYQIDTNKQNEAQIILNAPLHIVVENIENDKLFLQNVIEKFAKIKNKDAERITEALNKNWLRFSHGGGSDWGKVVEDLHGTYQHHRVFVISDSDKLYPTEQSRKKTSIETKCKAQNIPFHVLYKREIENYLPLKALKKLAEDLGKIAIYEEFLMLTEAERDFYDLEKGLLTGNQETDAKARRQFLEIQQANGLFISLTDAQIRRLEIGFGNKSKIMSYFDDVTAYDLIEHCKHHPILARQNPQGEMIDLLSKIAKAL